MKKIKSAFKLFLLSFKIDCLNSMFVLIMSIIIGLLPYFNTQGMLIIADLPDTPSIWTILFGILLVISATLGTRLLNSLNNIFLNKLSVKLDLYLKKRLKEKIIRIDYRERELDTFQQDLNMAYNSIDSFGLIKMISFGPLLISNLIILLSLSIILIKCSIIIWVSIMSLTFAMIYLRNKLINKNIINDRMLIDERILEDTLIGNITNSNLYAELRINNAVDWSINKWELQQKKLFAKESIINKKFQWKNSCINFLSHDFTFIFSLVLLMLMKKINLTSIVIVFTAIQNLINNLYIFSTEISIIDNYLGMFNFYEKIFNYSDCELVNKKEVDIKTNLFLTMKNVWFKYNDKYVLKNINFDVYSGDKIAIVGYNGSGKTTILKLLLGLYIPNKGNITYNKCADNEKPYVSVVFQDFARYKFSLRENLCLYNSNKIISDGKVFSILKKYKLDNLLCYNPDTLLANEFGGIDLSTGQWQKIALIRAKFKDNYNLMIMDEATSALDSFAESDLLNELLNEKITLLYVCHRLTCVKSFSKIIFLDSGEIVGIGTHNDLMITNLKYKEMYLMQSNEYV